jgi:hypothetical protein
MQVRKIAKILMSVLQVGMHISIFIKLINAQEMFTDTALEEQFSCKCKRRQSIINKPACSGYRLSVPLATCCNSSYLSDVITPYILLTGQKWRRREQTFSKSKVADGDEENQGICDFSQDL